MFPATIERKFPAPVPAGLDREGWSWDELDHAAAPKAHRDALKLLAVFLQHTHSKPQQQRIVCLDEDTHDRCEHPWMMINDVGLTFGRASHTNASEISSANLEAWSHTPVFRAATGCIGNLPRSLTGSLDNPTISEEGRAFLAERLALLSDAQIQSLFSTARFDVRPRDPRDPKSPAATIGEWVDAFKAKRREIVVHRC